MGAVAAVAQAISQTVSWEGGWTMLYDWKMWGGLSALALDVAIPGFVEELSGGQNHHEGTGLQCLRCCNPTYSCPELFVQDRCERGMWTIV